MGGGEPSLKISVPLLLPFGSEGFCRTASATPGLLNIYVLYYTLVYSAIIFVFKLLKCFLKLGVQLHWGRVCYQQATISNVKGLTTLHFFYNPMLP